MNAACEVTFQQPDHEITQFFFIPMQINQAKKLYIRTPQVYLARR